MAYVCVCRLHIRYMNLFFRLFISYFGDRTEHKSLEKMVPMTNSCDYNKKKGEKHTVKHIQSQRHLSTHIKVNFVLVQMVYVCTERWIYIPHHAYTMNPIFLCRRLRLRCCFFSLIFETHEIKRVKILLLLLLLFLDRYTLVRQRKKGDENTAYYICCVMVFVVACLRAECIQYK